MEKTWKGVTTWSGCMINQDESKSTIGPNGIGLGFSSIHPSQIIAMSTTDANVSHETRQLEVTTENGNEIQFQYSKQFMEETEKRIEGETQYRDLTHTYNEVASHRRTQELSTIKPNTYGGKTMPDYIYTYGKDSGERGIKLAKDFGLNYIIEYNDEAYLEKGKTRQADREEVISPLEEKRENSEFIKKLKEIQGDHDQDERG